MERKRPVCEENDELAEYLWNKWREQGETAKGISTNIDMTFSKAYSNVCACKTPITTLRDLSQIKGVGKWISKKMQGFFATESHDNVTSNNCKKNKGPKRYVPQKNSVAYALIITLFRETKEGDGFMHKNELIDAAEASGLSRVPIAPEKAKGKDGFFGTSPRDWYTGWSCMKTLISKGLVVKYSCPAKYMLTTEGKEVALDCISRSGLDNPSRSFDFDEELRVETQEALAEPVLVSCVSVEKSASKRQRRPKESTNISPEYLDKVYSQSFYGSNTGESNPGFSNSELNACSSLSNSAAISKNSSPTRDLAKSSCTLKACSSRNNDMSKHGSHTADYTTNKLAVPPLTHGERFCDVYELILILDQREQFTGAGFRSGKLIENICSQFQIKIEVRRLPVGDAVWIARHKYRGIEYVLDFIVERKKVDDLRTSIRDNRYRDQKLRLQRCGLKKMIYLIEGDPNFSEAAESIKTACFTTEILEGFDVQRTSGLADTLKKYGHLTWSINQYYRSLDRQEKSPGDGMCRPFNEFITMCQELDKLTVSDVFAVQLMQVPQVTEDVALAVLEMYPTLISLARAYSLIDGDVRAQEDMLREQSKNLISASASKNIYQLVWGG